MPLATSTRKDAHAILLKSTGVVAQQRRRRVEHCRRGNVDGIRRAEVRDQKSADKDPGKKHEIPEPLALPVVLKEFKSAGKDG
jgi:hypothetical protein